MSVSRARQFLRRSADAVLRPLFHLGLSSTPILTGKLMPWARFRRSFALPRGDPEEVPPSDLWVGYADDPEEYLRYGREDMASVLDLLERHGIARPRVALDLGCAAGRMIRHFPRGEGGEVWGADINARSIQWCQRNLPGINFVTVTTAPHLPFPDDCFDYVQCASVFTHITELADAWLLEIRRVLKPGGHLYATIHDEAAAEEMVTKYAAGLPKSLVREINRLLREGRACPAGFEMLVFGADPYSQVVYDRDHITRKWSAWMDLVAYEPQFHNYQSAMLFRKRAG